MIAKHCEYCFILKSVWIQQ